MSEPGLVNAHTHLELGALAGRIPEGLEFTEWVLALIRLRNQLSEGEFAAAIDQAIGELHAMGTVAVGDISSTGASVEPLLHSGLAGVVYFEVLGFGPVAMERFAQACRKIDAWRSKQGRMQVGLSIHAPYSSQAALFSAAAVWCQAEQVPLCIHIAESPAEAHYLASGEGPFAELNRRFNPDLVWQPPACSPIQYLERLGVLEVRPLLIHGVQVDEADLALLAERDCPMVHCPRSNNRLLTGRMPLERYLAHGVRVALGTDSLASAPSLDIRDELEAARQLHGDRVSEAALMELATSGGWQALGM